MVDLQKGERYINSDYALAGALEGTDGIPYIGVSYDIACQYDRHFEERFRAQFPSVKDFSRFRFYIPKMHLYAHRDNCHYQYSFNYTAGSGRTDGEACERGWAELNQFSTSTREMNGAHRHEVLEDRISDINFRKQMDMRKFGLGFITFRD